MKKLIIGVCIILFLVIAGFIFLKGKTHDIVITQDQLEEKLSEKFPITKKHLLLLHLTYENPELTLLPDNKVRIGMDAAVNFSLDGEGEALDGGVTALTELRYDHEQQALYLDNAKIERLDIEGVPNKWEEKVMTLTTEVINLYLKNNPVYELKHRNKKESAAKMLLKDFKVRDQSIVVTVGL